MHHAISLPNMGSAEGLVRLAAAADSNGWSGVFLWDHLQFDRSMRLDVFDAWVTLGAMATATSRLRLGTLVTPLPRRRPWVLAKQLITLDHLSRGRAVLGVGIGFPAADEFGAFGDVTDDRTRGGMLDEGLEIVDQCLRGGHVSASGDHYAIDAVLHPGAVQQPRPPIWVAGMWPGRRPFRRAARWDGVAPVSASGDPLRPEDIAEMVAAVGGARPGFDVVATAHWEHTAEEYAQAGATWLVESRWPVDNWFEELLERASSAP
jgi:alkanesulfonate monooxygenase SsuD/methylene tetrahydromethanopterin reductase-like flavin-dependent oxidoreductase (luciferase family)